MIGQETREVERKAVAILKVLSDSPEPLGGRVIAHRLGDLGIGLGERAVRYHLKLMDEKGLTQSVGRRDGRLITKQGIEELNSALVIDKVSSIAARTDVLAYRTTLDPAKGMGDVPIDTSLFREREFKRALNAMKEAFKGGLCVSLLVAVARKGERLGEIDVPPGWIGLATVSSVTINGVFLKAGIPIVSRFGGIVQMRSHKPLRFVELIEYSGCSVDPAEIFLASRMTSVSKAARAGNGRILASFRDLPATCRPAAEMILLRLREVGIGGVLAIGEVNMPVLEIPMGLNKVGIILQSGLNPSAMAAEAGIEVVNRAMSGVIDYNELGRVWDL